MGVGVITNNVGLVPRYRKVKKKSISSTVSHSTGLLQSFGPDETLNRTPMTVFQDKLCC